MYYHVSSLLLLLLLLVSDIYITYSKTFLIDVFIALHLVGYKTVYPLYLNWVNHWLTDSYLFLLSEHHSRSRQCPGDKVQDNITTNGDCDTAGASRADRYRRFLLGFLILSTIVAVLIDHLLRRSLYADTVRFSVSNFIEPAWIYFYRSTNALKYVNMLGEEMEHLQKRYDDSVGQKFE